MRLGILCIHIYKTHVNHKLTKCRPREYSLWGVKIVYVKVKKGEDIYLELIRIVVKKPVTAFMY